MSDKNKFLAEMKSSSQFHGSPSEEPYNKKLWHQLTKLLGSLKLITIYREFIVDFESRIDPLST